MQFHPNRRMAQKTSIDRWLPQKFTSWQTAFQAKWQQWQAGWQAWVKRVIVDEDPWTGPTWQVDRWSIEPWDLEPQGLKPETPCPVPAASDRQSSASID